ncbi:MAG TPA: superinfection immunity protein [Acidimicrobiia bacterium]|nr:superinfection immunity protein [Acidimicrobiia bacterium]
MLGGLAVLYFLPSIIARKKHNANSVFVVNLFLGWTLIGWIVALAMAANNPPTSSPAVVQSPPAPTAESGGRTCPFCAEDIRPAAVVCKHCGRDLPTADQ